jgi:hypothetical protein
MKLFTPSKKVVFVLAVLIVGSLLGVAIAMASGETKGTEQKAPEVVAQQEAQAGNESGYIVVNGYTDLYERSYARATTDEQREQLKAIFADHSLGIGEWVRPVLITLGDLPENTPRLTVQDAANLYGKIEFADMEKEFNKIAGAPDWVGGSGIYRAIYYLNDKQTEAIYLMLGDVFYYVNNADGTSTRLPIGDQKLPEPRPTTPPSDEPIKLTPRPEVTPDPADANVLHNLDGTETIIDINALKAQ